AGDGDTLLQAHKLGKHQGARHHRNALRLRGEDLDVVRRHCGGHDHGVRRCDVVGLVAEHDLRPETREPLGRRIRSEVRAAHFVAQIEQYLRDAAHSTAADADKMNSLDLVLHGASSAQAAATAEAAPGRASDRARLAMSRNRKRSNPASTSASRSGLSSLCGTRTAAPASARKRALAVWWSSTACG